MLTSLGLDLKQREWRKVRYIQDGGGNELPYSPANPINQTLSHDTQLIQKPSQEWAAWDRVGALLRSSVNKCVGLLLRQIELIEEIFFALRWSDVTVWDGRMNGPS